MNCPNCHSQQAEDAKFCNQCGTKMPMIRELKAQAFQDWITEFLKKQWKKNPHEPYLAIKICGDNRIVEIYEEITVTLGINPWPDDEGTYAPAAEYTIEAQDFYYRSTDDDYHYGDIYQLDRIYKGPSISSFLQKTQEVIDYPYDYWVSFTLGFHQDKAEEIKEAENVSFEQYFSCFSIK